MTEYVRADFTPLRSAGYGVGFHWTTATVPPGGEPAAYEDAVAAFDVDAFVAQAAEMGAGYVLFTSTHSRHHFPGPNAQADRILPGRTCRRDLLMELADGLAEAGIRLALYYNSGIHPGDPEWRRAVGAVDDPRAFFDNWARVVGWMGEHYGEKVIAWWIDGGYELDSFDDTPWASLTAAAKAGNPGRLVCYNPGIERHHLYTPLQDYWAGEVCRLNYIPRGPVTSAGLPWHAFVSWHGDSRKPTCGAWVMGEPNRAVDWWAPHADSAVAFLRGFQRVGGAVTFNVLCYQDGSAFAPDLEVMREVKERVRP